MKPRDESKVAKYLLDKNFKPTCDPVFGEKQTEYPGNEDEASQKLYAEKVVVNPLLLEHSHTRNRYWTLLYWIFKLPAFSRADESFAFKFKFRDIAKSGSCRKMYLTQPPQTSAMIMGLENQSVMFKGNPDWFRRPGKMPTVTNPSGLTFGDLIDESRMSALNFGKIWFELCWPGVFVDNGLEIERRDIDWSRFRGSGV